MARARQAFTLIELLVVIAIIALLLAIVVPTLAAAREQARNAVSLSNLRSNAQVILTYAGDWQDAHPFLTDPDRLQTTLRGGGVEIQTFYWHISAHWPHPLTDEYFGGQINHPALHRPGAKFFTTSTTSYFYSAAMIADPLYWNEQTRAGPEQWRRTLTSEVVFPSSKALLVDFGEAGHTMLLPGQTLDRPVTMALSDASVQRVPPERNIPPMPLGDGGIGLQSLFPFGAHAMHTRDGVRGRDIR